MAFLTVRKLLFASVAIIVVVAVAWTTLAVRASRRWPFSTGTQDAAFLGTTFGMSPQEVGRALANADVRLVTGDEYVRERSARGFTLNMLMVPDSWQPAIAEDRTRYTSLFMPSVKMWDSAVEAKFEFRDNRLAFVEVDIDPLAHADAPGIVSSIKDRLQSGYQFRAQENSKDVPGAYTLHYDSSAANPSLWVNLTDPEHPIISLFITHPATVDLIKREVDTRQQRAFGRN